MSLSLVIGAYEITGPLAQNRRASSKILILVPLDYNWFNCPLTRTPSRQPCTLARAAVETPRTE